MTEDQFLKAMMANKRVSWDDRFGFIVDHYITTDGSIIAVVSKESTGGIAFGNNVPISKLKEA